MLFCGYPSFRCDLVGCWGLNTKKNEKKTIQSLEGGSPEKQSYVDGGVDWLFDLMGGGPKQ